MLATIDVEPCLISGDLVGLEISLSTQCPDCIQYYDAYHQEDYVTQELMDDPIAFAASSNPDILYHHEAMKQPDRLKFLDAMMVQELNAHIDNKNWELVDKLSIPKGVKVLDAVWALRRK